MEEADAAGAETDLIDDIVVHMPTDAELGSPTWRLERDDHLAAVQQLVARVRAAAPGAAQQSLVRLVHRARLADMADGSGQFGIYNAVGGPTDEDLAVLIAAKMLIAQLWRAVEMTGPQQDATKARAVSWGAIARCFRHSNRPLPQVARVLDGAEAAYDVRAAVEAAFELRTCDVYTILVEIDDLARAIGALEPLVVADAAASRSDTAARRRALGLASLRGAAQHAVRRLFYVGQTVRGAPTRIEREHEVSPSGWANPGGGAGVFISDRFVAGRPDAHGRRWRARGSRRLRRGRRAGAALAPSPSPLDE